MKIEYDNDRLDEVREKMKNEKESHQHLVSDVTPQVITKQKQSTSSSSSATAIAEFENGWKNCPHHRLRVALCLEPRVDAYCYASERVS